MKSDLAKARDKWLLSNEGELCCHGSPTGQYLRNRLVTAFTAGHNFSIERITELEGQIQKAKDIVDSQSFWCESAKQECVGLKSIVHLFKQALKGK